MNMLEFPEKLRQLVEEFIPFNNYIGLQALLLEPGRAILAIPFRKEYIGDPTRPALHGGITSMLIDAAGGAAVFTKLGVGDRCSTVDLRVDYLRPAPLNRLIATADVIRMGNRVAVANIQVHAEGSLDIIAEGKGVYNIVRGEKKGNPYK